MENLSNKELREVSRLFEITNDAVALCRQDGTILHANVQLLDLLVCSRKSLVGCDIKDILFSMDFERSSAHELPFDQDGSASVLKLRLAEGSFVPVEVRAGAVSGSTFGLGRKGDTRVLVAMRSLEERYSHDRQMQRVLTELKGANKRLAGTLSVIMAAVGAQDLPALVDTVLNKLTDALDAAGATLYFSEGGGFKLRGISDGLASSYVPEYIPYGAGVPTYVLRRAEACRLQILTKEEVDIPSPAAFEDMDTKVMWPLRMQDMPPFRTAIAVPVFFGTQVLGVIELGWERSLDPSTYDVSVLEVICDYLSIQLMGLVGSIRSQRTSELTRSLNRVRDLMFKLESCDGGDALAALTNEVRRTLGCYCCPVVFDAARKRFMIDFEGGSQVELPGEPETLFFSTTAPAPRLGSVMDDRFASPEDATSFSGELERVRITRVEASSSTGVWLATHGLPCQGVYMDFGLNATYRDGADSPAIGEGEGIVLADEARRGLSGRVLLLRDATCEPIDDMEYDYLLHLSHDYELIERGESQKREERHIAQTLQAGMRSSLGSVPGITTDSLYSSATRSALVGGDFYTLLRLPDDRAVMILGDVSGKGVEAASMSALVKTALSAYAWEGMAPHRMARSLNNMLMGFSRIETFATMFIASIDLRAGRATYCSAGHPPTMLVHPPLPAHENGPGHEGEVELLSCQSGVVGAFEGMKYEAGTFSFAPGDVLFMYTDGAIEARDPAGEFFGEQHLRDLLLMQSGSDVRGLCARVLAELDTYTASALDDDIALVALRFDECR